VKVLNLAGISAKNSTIAAIDAGRTVRHRIVNPLSTIFGENA
jgi:hypothetical protein